MSVDLDEIREYCAIHGLSSSSLAGRSLVYDVAVPRLLAFAERQDIPLTLFAVGRDAREPEKAAHLKEAVGHGHEIGNHTDSHEYGFSRLPPGRMADEIERAQDAIERVSGYRPVGFRAPGYVVNAAVFEALERSKMSYDSSVFPCPWYWGAKLTAIGAWRVRGRKSKSLVDDPRVLTAPTRPYRTGNPYWNAGNGLLELPIQVTPRARLPFIGTSLMLAGPTHAGRLTRFCSTEPFVNLELHGIDVLDVSDGLSELLSYQPDIRVPRDRKLRVLETVISVLRSAGYQFVTLAEAAQKWHTPSAAPKSV